MYKVLTKSLGPIGQPRYRWISIMDDNEALYDEMLASAKELGFRIVTVYDYGGHKEFSIEPKNESQDALFILTWADHINTDQYEHDKGRKFPADWITKVLYYTVRGADHNLPLAIFIPVCLIVIPMWVSKIWNTPLLPFISVIGLIMMLSLVCLRIYDDSRVANHEHKLRMRDDTRGGLNEEF